jgi:glycosyltransferase involved in cell wall biosynthesis
MTAARIPQTTVPETIGTPHPRKRICIVATVPFAMDVFMRPHIAALRREFDVTLVASGTPNGIEDLLGEHVRFRSIPIERKIRVTKDLRALIELWRLFRAEQFDAVHSFMPKAGLLAMLAARLAGVPVRVNTFTGQLWQNRTGIRRRVLVALDRMMARCATRVLADGHAQRHILVASGIVRNDKLVILCDGSFAGVDLKRFAMNAEARAQIREELKLPAGAVLFTFVGRLNVEKGLLDLARAFEIAATQDTSVHLSMVGPDEQGLDAVFAGIADRFPGRMHRIGYTPTPETYISAADVICLPSHREGFPNVPLQAAASGLPVLASRIYGICDAVEDGVTGILHTPASAEEIANGMLRLARDPELRRRLGTSGRCRVVEKFSEDRLTAAFSEFYRTSLSTVLKS